MVRDTLDNACGTLARLVISKNGFMMNLADIVDSHIGDLDSKCCTVHYIGLCIFAGSLRPPQDEDLPRKTANTVNIRVTQLYIGGGAENKSCGGERATFFTIL